MAWWQDDGALRRFLQDLIEGEFRRLRPGRATPAGRPWPDSLAIDVDGLGADSIELIALSAAVAEALGLSRSGAADLLLARRTLGGWLGVCRESLACVDDAIVFRTSGSVGQPKSCSHELASLDQEVAALAALLPGRRVLSAVPAHHIYGFLFSILLPQRLGVEAVELPRSSAAGLAARLRPDDLVIAHPAYWRGVRRSGGPVPSAVTAVTSTAPCPPDLFDGLRAQGFARLVEIYGATETAGIGWRDGGGPFTLMPHWSFAPGGGGLLRREQPGAACPVAAPDRLVPTSDRHFTVAGRLDGAVQVGGVNVHPEHVRAVLRRHPLVVDASVRLMRPDEGDRLKAFIVMHRESDSPAARAELERWIEGELAVFERPRALTFGPALPVGPLDKPSDWNIAREAGAASDPLPAPAGPPGVA